MRMALSANNYSAYLCCYDVADGEEMRGDAR